MTTDNRSYRATVVWRGVLLRWRDMGWCGQTVVCWIVAKYWATCASDRVVLGRVRSYRLLYTDARPSLCVHSIPWRRRVNISFCHVHPLGTCASLPIKISPELLVLLREVWRPAYWQHTSTTTGEQRWCFRTLRYCTSSFRLLKLQLWLST